MLWTWSSFGAWILGKGDVAREYGTCPRSVLHIPLRLGRAIAKIWRGHLTTLPENLHTMKLAVNGAELEVNHRHESWLNRELFETAYGRLQHMDLPLRDVDDAWDRLQRLRTVYGVQLQSLCRSSTLRSSLHPVPGLTPAARWPIASGQADSSRAGRRCRDTTRRGPPLPPAPKLPRP